METVVSAELCSLATMGRLPGQERPRRYDFDEILPTMNASRDSVYFASKNETYAEGMRVFITYPYSDSPGSINREYLGEVIRIDELGHGRRGIAVQLLMSLYLGGKETVR